MNKYAVCLLVVLILVSAYYLFYTESNTNPKQSKKVSLLDEISSMKYDAFKDSFGKDLEETDSMLLYINAKSACARGSEMDLKNIINAKVSSG